MAVTHASWVTRVLPFISILVVLLNGCAPSQTGRSVGCELFNDPLRTISLDDLSPPVSLEWIQETYGVGEESMWYTAYDGEQPTSRRSWDSGPRGYSMYFSGENANNAYMIWEESQPTLQTVLDCLGEPSYYGAYFNEMPAGWLFELELWYPEEGLMVEYAEPVRGRQAPTVGPDFPIEEMTITRPGDLESVVRAAYGPRAEEVIQVALQTVQPWPDDLADLQITTDVRR